MRKLDLYLVKQFLSILTASICAFTSIFVIVDLIENLDKFIDSSVPITIISQYYLYYFPWFINIGLPMGMLIATIFTFGLMAKRNELVAMKSSGISLYRIAVPIIFISIMVSMISFYFDNQLVTLGNQKRRTIEKEHLKKRGRKYYRERRNNIFLQKSNKFHIAIDRYQSKREKALGVSMQFLESGNLLKRIDTKWMKWDPEKRAWNLHVYAIREFQPDGFESRVRFSNEDTLLVLDFTPKDISLEAISPEERNFVQLKGFIKELRNNGVDTTRWEVNLHNKLSFAFTNLIVVLFGLPLVTARTKGSLAFGAGMSVFVIFGYYAFIRFGQTLGYKGIVEPLMSAWIGNIVFSVGGIILMIFSKK